MDNDDVVALAARDPDAHIVAVHFETVSHSTETRADLRARLRAEGLQSSASASRRTAARFRSKRPRGA